MNREKLETALGEVSDRHIAQAAAPKRRKFPRILIPIAAVLAVALVVGMLRGPTAIRAKAVSLAEYPPYEQGNRQDMTKTMTGLQRFFTDSIAAVLSGSGKENQAFSPANLYMALAEVAQLSQGEAGQEILDLLGADSPAALQTQANEFWNACYVDNDHTVARLASSIWLDEGLGYDQAAMDALAEHFYTSVYQADLQSGGTQRDITAWVNQQTGGHLKQAVGDPDIAPETVFALYSTVFFQSKWTYYEEFNPRNNTTAPFHTPSGEVTCTYMNKKEMQSDYYWGEDFGAVYLPLRQGQGMWFLLPDPGKTPQDVLASGEYAKLLLGHHSPSELMEYENQKYVKINFSVPKFDITSNGKLSQTLRALGVNKIFDPDANAFAGAIEGPAWVSEVNQATRLTIDEEGVTAASYIEMLGAGAAKPPEEIIDFVLDRPFLCVITNASSIPLFAAVVQQP